MSRASILVFALLLPSLAWAQARLHTPDASPKATVSQTVGLTEMTIVYHRPAVSGRTIWGDLVPYGQVWRAGANENTTIQFSSAVTVGGKKLAAGTYGIHTIPGEKSWTVILSTMSSAWGSYTYDQKEDAVRLTAAPEAAPMVERLSWSFDDPGDGKVLVALRWEKLRVAFPVEVDTKSVVVASLRGQLRGAATFSADRWNDAAAWCLAHDTNLDEAAKWNERSLSMKETYANLETRALFLERKKDAKGAADYHARALAIAGEADLNQRAYDLLGKGKTDEAIEVFTRITKEHPKSWNAWDSLGEGLAKKGDKAAASASYEKAMSLTADPTMHKRIGEILLQLKK